jgi:hypothetical protein
MLILKGLSVLFYAFDAYGAFSNVLAVRKNFFSLRGGMCAFGFTTLQQEGQIGPGNAIDGPYPREISSALQGLSLGMMNASVESASPLEQGEHTRWDDSISGQPLNASDERNLLRLQLRVAQVQKTAIYLGSMARWGWARRPNRRARKELARAERRKKRSCRGEWGQVA